MNTFVATVKKYKTIADMDKSKSSESSQRGIDNHLDNQPQENFSDSSQKNNPLSSYKSNGTAAKNTPEEKPQETSDEDIIDRILRSLLTLFAAAFSSGIAAGILEAVMGWNITFASLPMLAITAALFYPYYKLFSWLGFFKN